MQRMNGALTGEMDHLISVGDGSWGLWRWFCLRSAGFPAHTIQGLADAALTSQADGVLLAERDLEQGRSRAKQAVNRALDALRAAGAWEDKPRRNPLLNALRSIDRNEPPRTVEDEEVSQALGGFRAALSSLAEARSTYQQEYVEATSRISSFLGGFASTAPFREALVWQNRHALHGSMATAAGGGNAGRKSRRKDLSIARYVQRYCTKNDTIGFFGPVGWARFTTEGEAMDLSHGPSLLANREVFFEGWAIETIADQLSQDPDLRPWMTPRMAPFLHLEGGLLRIPMSGPVRVPAQHADILRLCDGKRTAVEVARTVVADPLSSVTDEAEVYQILHLLARQRRITWDFEMPIALRPEVYLKRQLEAIEEPALRRRSMAPLEELIAAREAVVQAMGDPDRLDQAMEGLEQTFTKVTGQAPTRKHGEIYAARTLVYLESLRDVQVAIGPDAIQALSEPLALLLQSVRWFHAEAAKIYRSIFQEIYGELSSRSGSPTVTLADLWLWAGDLLFKEDLSQLEPLSAEFQRRWGEILALTGEERAVTYTAEQIRPKVMQAFAAPGPGWDHCRHHSPDIMIAAESVEAIRAGDYQFVLGELHMAMNTLGITALLSQHPAPEELARAVKADIPDPRILMASGRSWNLNARTSVSLASPEDLWLIGVPDARPVPEWRTLTVGDLVVEQVGDDLIARTHDRTLSMDLLDLLSYALTPPLTDRFQLRPPGTHSPRVTIDRLVVLRESWRFEPGALAFFREEQGANRFLAIRRWAQEHGIPRYAFVRTPLESKPFLVDYESPVLVEIFATAVCAALESDESGRPTVITEMLPSLDHLWLSDAQGNRYTSELRVTAVDRADGFSFDDL